MDGVKDVHESSQVEFESDLTKNLDTFARLKLEKWV